VPFRVKSLVNPKPGAMMCRDARMRWKTGAENRHPAPGEKCGLGVIENMKTYPEKIFSAR
jgi:hypothetical protein